MMKHLSTRRKRRLGFANTHLAHRYAFRKAPTVHHMKSFPTEEAARAWATATGVDEKSHELRFHEKGRKWQWHKC